MKTTEYDLIIDADLQTHLPSVDAISDNELEAQLVANGGPDEPIRVWKTRNVIVDGHRRYAICKTHDLPYEKLELDFKTIQEVKDWMDAWQASRRNIDSLGMAELASRLVSKSKKRKQEVGAGPGSGNVAAQVAEQTGVTPRTVYRAQKLAAAIDSLPKDLRDDINSKALPITQKDIIELSEMSAEDQRNIHEGVKSGEYKSFRDAIHGEEPELEREAPKSGDAAPLPATKKPFGIRLNNFQKTLGILTRQLDDLKDEDPLSYQQVRKHLGDINSAIMRWRKPASSAA